MLKVYATDCRSARLGIGTRRQGDTDQQFLREDRTGWSKQSFPITKYASQFTFPVLYYANTPTPIFFTLALLVITIFPLMSYSLCLSTYLGPFLPFSTLSRSFLALTNFSPHFYVR